MPAGFAISLTWAECSPDIATQSCPSRPVADGKSDMTESCERTKPSPGFFHANAHIRQFGIPGTHLRRILRRALNRRSGPRIVTGRMDSCRAQIGAICAAMAASRQGSLGATGPAISSASPDRRMNTSPGKVPWRGWSSSMIAIRPYASSPRTRPDKSRRTASAWS